VFEILRKGRKDLVLAKAQGAQSNFLKQELFSADDDFLCQHLRISKDAEIVNA
jgi:hypothetical protein